MIVASLGRLRGALGADVGRLGAILGRLAALLGRLGGLGPNRASLMASWGFLGGLLGAS